MEPNNESGVTSSYFQLSTLSPHPPSDGGPTVFSVSGKAPSPAPPVESHRRKRGRPRKYGTPEAAAAAKRAYAPAAAKKKEKDVMIGDGSSNSSSNKPSLVSVGGQGFTPHVINADAGEDVGQKIMSFMQHAGRELCILSASGSVTRASLLQPDISGGSVSYEGRFDIVSLTGSYVSSEYGGKTGSLSACLSSTNGEIIGGGIGGPLIADGPVEVILATFVIDPKKDNRGGFKGDASGSKMLSPPSASNTVYRPVVESSGEFGGDDHQNMHGSHFMMQPQWRGGIDYDLGGNTGHDSPENGDYEHIHD